MLNNKYKIFHIQAYRTGHTHAQVLALYVCHIKEKESDESCEKKGVPGSVVEKTV